MSTGTIVKRVSKKGAVSWLLKYDAGRDAAGLRQQRYKTVRGSKSAAEKELRRLLAEVDAGTHVGPTRVTVSRWVEQWLQTLESRQTVSARTLEGYAAWLRVHVLPTLGEIEIQKLTAAHIDGLYTRLLKSGSRSSAARASGEAIGLSPQTVLHIHRAVFTCLKAATRKRLLARNPAEDVEAPRARRARNGGGGEGDPMKALDKDQCATLLDAFRGKPLWPIVVLGLGTGLRRGEMLALRWSSIDLDKKTLTVSRSVERTSAGIRVKAEAKNESSRRTIGIDDELVELLRAHRRGQKELALRLGVPYPPDSLLFPMVVARHKGRQPARLVARDVDFNRPSSPDAVSKEFTRVARTLGFQGFTLHCLRHTHATQLLEVLPVHPVSQRLGHSSPVVTSAIYSHVLKRAEDRAAAVSGDLLKAALRR